MTSAFAEIGENEYFEQERRVFEAKVNDLERLADGTSDPADKARVVEELKHLKAKNEKRLRGWDWLQF